MRGKLATLTLKPTTSTSSMHTPCLRVYMHIQDPYRIDLKSSLCMISNSRNRGTAYQAGNLPEDQQRNSNLRKELRPNKEVSEQTNRQWWCSNAYHSWITVDSNNNNTIHSLESSCLHCPTLSKLCNSSYPNPWCHHICHLRSWAWTHKKCWVLVKIKPLSSPIELQSCQVALK